MKGFLTPCFLAAAMLVGAWTAEAATCGQLSPGQSLTAGAELSSCDGNYTLVMQLDGNLVNYQKVSGNKYGRAAFATYTRGTNNHADMQTDGNFVVYDSSSRPLYYTNTPGNTGA